MTGAISEVPAAGIGKLLQDQRFIVPNHQRDYSWTEDEVNQLFDDVEGAMDRDSEAYFLGLMVFLNHKAEHLTVLDGQQRLATVILIFSAIRNWLQQYSEHRPDAGSIQEWFIGRNELGEREPLPRMTMNAANNPTFTEYVIKSVPPGDIEKALTALKKQDRNRKLLEAAALAHGRISTLATKAGSPEAAAKYFVRLVKFIRDDVKVVRLEVTSEEAAYTIFETLNDRGLELSPLDLVKNYLFSRADLHSQARVRDMEQRWGQMMSTLANVRPGHFLKTFWTSRHGRIRTTNLFDMFKREYPGVAEALTLSMEMLEASEQYAALDTVDDPVWSPYSDNARATVRSLKVIGSQQAHPVMLAALARMAPREVERVLRLLEVVIVRYLVVGGGNTGRFETTCAKLARSIYTKEVVTAAQALQELKEIYVPDEDFHAMFRAKQERNNQKAQYFLKAIEREEQRLAKGAMAGEEASDWAPSALTVEHILPKSPGDEWAEVLAKDPTIVEECAFRLGNLSLLTKVNKDVGRKSFESKREVYADSGLIITRRLSEVDRWDRQEIDHRQSRMAKLAGSIWRFQ